MHEEAPRPAVYCCGPRGFTCAPRVRGTFFDELLALVAGRFIPARAGNTRHRLAWISLASAHPRSRGEHVGAVRLDELFRGSSPLARGKFPRRPREEPGLRLIPARAGNITSSSSPKFSCSAHPRSRGEHTEVGDARQATEGTSPLARGTSVRLSYGTAAARLISAHAGNTHTIASNELTAAAHPRSHGEHVSPTLPTMVSSGSSPLARGTFLRLRNLRV
mgnify:CR=1 FL=1